MNLRGKAFKAFSRARERATDPPLASGDTSEWEAPYKLAKKFLDLCPLALSDWEEQKDLFDQLVRLGTTAIPAIESALDAGRQTAHFRHVFENMGLLCEALGRIGGARAFEILAACATAPSNIIEYSHVREGAIRGLGFVDAPGVISLLRQLLSQRPDQSAVIIPSLRQHGIQVGTPDYLDASWAKDAVSWKEIAEAFVNFEAGKEKPDFKSLREKVRSLPAEQKHGVWRTVGDTMRDKGDALTRAQCFVEALVGDASSAYGTWNAIKLPPSVSAEALMNDLRSVAERPFEEDKDRNRDLVKRLRSLVGEPGESRSWPL
jgi:hypothetical protein